VERLPALLCTLSYWLLNSKKCCEKENGDVSLIFESIRRRTTCYSTQHTSTQLLSSLVTPRMTPRASEGGGSTGLSPSLPLPISKQQPLPTPPSSQSPPDMTELHDKELPDPPNESAREGEEGKGGILSGEGKATFQSLSEGTAEGRIRYRGTATSKKCTGAGQAGLHTRKRCRLVQPSLINFV